MEIVAFLVEHGVVVATDHHHRSKHHHRHLLPWQWKLPWRWTHHYWYPKDSDPNLRHDDVINVVSTIDSCSTWLDSCIAAEAVPCDYCLEVEMSIVAWVVINSVKSQYSHIHNTPSNYYTRRTWTCVVLHFWAKVNVH